MKVAWYKLYAFVVGREIGDSPRYWFYSYCVYPAENNECQK
jgi:hypothetical protein